MTHALPSVLGRTISLVALWAAPALAQQPASPPAETTPPKAPLPASGLNTLADKPAQPATTPAATAPTPAPAGAVVSNTGPVMVPHFTYNPINRDVPVTVSIPKSVKGEASIKLLEPLTAKELGTASVNEGEVNLATLFPKLWTDRATVMYAQLFVGADKVGPALVLQPMLNVARAYVSQGSRNVVFQRPPSVVFTGYRIYADKHILMTTTEGDIEFELRPDAAPNTAWNFRELVGGGYYRDIIFHRIVPNGPNGPFVIQVGDPTGSGGGGPGYSIDLEQSNLPHDFGVLSMARTGEPDTGGSQVFVCLSREGTAFLDGQYTTFANAVTGADVIVKLSQVKLEGERPVDPPKIKSAKLIDAPPYGTGPKPVKRPVPSTAR